MLTAAHLINYLQERGGFDLIAQGMGGIMNVTGEPDGPPTSVAPPARAELNRAVQPFTNREPTPNAGWASGWPRRIQRRGARRRFRHYRRSLVVGRIPPHGSCGRKSSAHQNRHRRIAV